MLQISVETPRGGPLLSRRTFLRMSLVTTGALGFPGLLRQRAAMAAGRRHARDTAVIQLWLGGGPSHLDMYDLKPAAPAEIRGPFRPIATNVPGIQICELLPRQARLMHRLALVRSLHHTTNEHAQGMHWCLTGYFAPLADQGSEPTHPSVGSITARLRGANGTSMVPYVHVAPDPMGYSNFLRIHDAAYLGSRYAPLRIENARAQADPQNSTDIAKLISKVHFNLPSLELFPGLDIHRLGERSQLRQRFDGLSRRLDRSRAMEQLDEYGRKALQLISSARARRAFDLGREDPRLRDRYGMNAWGQGLLLCRRLVEAGVTFVTLNTDSFSGQWDNHVNLPRDFPQMLPVYDQMLTALLEDLVDRGLYERVLVLVWGEFGRTPKMNASAGRDHWGSAAFALLAGGGLKSGVVVGSTNPRGEEPKDRPVWPQDILATVYHVLGIDPSVEFPDQVGRPTKVLSSGEPLRELM